MPKRIVVFNHKSGVGKTTTVYNLGWLLSKTQRVLVVDADPQCTLSTLFLANNFEKYYCDKTTRLHNIKEGVSKAFEGRPTPIEAVNCWPAQRSPNLFLLAGHTNLAEYDAPLSFAQTSSNVISISQNLPGAFPELLRLTEEKHQIDMTIIDLSSSLSAINQNLLLASHAFLIPTNPDPFSIMAIETLQRVLPRWARWKKNSLKLFEDSAYPLEDGLPKFVGYTIQCLNSRNGQAAKPYNDNMAEIKLKMSTDFVPSMQKAGMALSLEQYGNNFIAKQFCLAELPDVQELLPKSHQYGVPLFALTDTELEETGEVLAQLRKKKNYFEELFNQIATDLVAIGIHV